MKIISWNVNGIQACLKKGLLEFIKNQNADIYCFQEVKSSPRELTLYLERIGYHSFYFPSERKGYSGILIYTKTKPKSKIMGIGNREIDQEGRVLTLEYDGFFLVNGYFPHSNRKLERLDFKLKFNKLFADFCDKLKNKKPLIIAADFNVAHQEIDLANPKQNEKNAGFTAKERKWFDNFLKHGYMDTFREFNKSGGHYTWWPWRNDCRKRNIGWRIDYFVVSKTLKNRLVKSSILKDVLGSDHCPIGLEIKF